MESRGRENSFLFLGTALRRGCSQPTSSRPWMTQQYLGRRREYLRFFDSLTSQLPICRFGLLFTRPELPQLEIIRHRPLEQSIPCPASDQEPDQPTAVSFPDPCLATAGPRPQPAPGRRAIQNLGYHAASVGIMGHRVVLTVCDSSRKLTVDRCVHGIRHQCTLSTCNARLHASGDHSSNMHSIDMVNIHSTHNTDHSIPERSQLDSEGVTERVKRRLGRIVNGSKHVGNDLSLISICNFKRSRTREIICTNPSHGSNLDNGALGFDKQRQECLAHGNHGEQIGLEGLSHFGNLHLHGRDRIVYDELVSGGYPQQIVDILRPLIIQT